MKVIGLTGGIASGKSLVSSILGDLGAIIIDADIIAREVVKKGSPTWDRIKEHFGVEYLLPNYEIDRKKLGQFVFSHAYALEELNRITHPAIMETIKEKINDLKNDGYNGIVVVDAALLLEKEWGFPVDEVWVVDAPTEQRIERLMARDHLSKEEALKRISSQMDRYKRHEKAHWIILNSTSFEDLKKQIEFLWGVIIKSQKD
ncbi:MAG: dephospho-CoA kinase [Clostridiales bacterium]|nr:dephospho-CoA kinase [Clostridiales bacterium]